jgi:branched-chain amino acid aminotransferase
MSYSILKKLLPLDQRKPLPLEHDEILFGRMPTDHLLVADFHPERGGWQNPEIIPFSNWSLRPDSLVFHYGQQIFEGLKAYKSPSGSVSLFRPNLNGERFFRSAVLMGMEPVPVEFFLSCIKELVSVERNWVLDFPGSLYIRPLLIPLDYGVSYRASLAYRFAVMLSPAKNYFDHDGGVVVSVERDRVRMVRGGVGEAKAGGNYGGSVAVLSQVKKVGCDHVLWLDGVERKYIEEVGAMNVMFVYRDGALVTPSLSGSILQGVTRQSIIELVRHRGRSIEEKRLSIDDVLIQIKNGLIIEAFGCGTAAVVSPITMVLDRGEQLIVGDGKVGKFSKLIKKELLGIQFGQDTDELGWCVEV